MEDPRISESLPEKGEAAELSDLSEKRRLMSLAELLQNKRNRFQADDSMASN